MDRYADALFYRFPLPRGMTVVALWPICIADQVRNDGKFGRVLLVGMSVAVAPVF